MLTITISLNLRALLGPIQSGLSAARWHVAAGTILMYHDSCDRDYHSS